MGYIEAVARVFLHWAIILHQEKWGFKPPKRLRPGFEEKILSSLRKVLSDPWWQESTTQWWQGCHICLLPEEGKVYIVRPQYRVCIFDVQKDVEVVEGVWLLDPQRSFDRQVYSLMVNQGMPFREAWNLADKDLRKTLRLQGIGIPQKCNNNAPVRELSLEERNELATQKGWCHGPADQWPGERYFLVTESLAHIKVGPREWGDVTWQTPQVPLVRGWSLIEMRDPSNKEIPSEEYGRKAELLREFLSEQLRLEEAFREVELQDSFHDRPRKVRAAGPHGKSREVKPGT